MYGKYQFSYKAFGYENIVNVAIFFDILLIFNHKIKICISTSGSWVTLMYISRNTTSPNDFDISNFPFSFSYHATLAQPHQSWD